MEILKSIISFSIALVLVGCVVAYMVLEMAVEKVRGLVMWLIKLPGYLVELYNAWREGKILA